MKNLNGIRPIKQGVEADLLKRPGVTGVDIGYKYTAGKKTDELSIRVFVKEKKDVPEKEMVPKTIKGVRTDVIQREFVLQPRFIRRADLELKADTGSYDPLKGGISIGPCRSIWCEPPDVPTAGWYIFVGTLGAIVKDKDSGNPMLLSNFHVMCVNDAWSVGDTMAQPSRVDGGTCPADVVGSLQRASLGGKVDCAVASHTARGYACKIVDIGDVAGTATATIGMAVRKRGRTTGLTYGTVDTVDLTVTIDYGDGLGNVTLTNQIGIDVDPAQSTQFGDHGDSGSVVVNNDRKVVGLHFAGNTDGTYGVANPIQDVLNALNVNICVPKAKEVEKKIEVKELEKKLELKEFEKKIEVKEIEKRPEKKIEIKERFKEFKEPKEIAEGFPFPPTRPETRRPLEERLSYLEAVVDQLTRLGPQAGVKHCIDFSTYSPMSVPNPWTCGMVKFYALDHAGNPWPNPGIKNFSGFIGLDCGYRLEISLSAPCRLVELTLVHFARPAKIEAYNADGTFAGSASMSGPEGVAETLTASGSITRVVIVAPQDETLLLRFCCAPENPELSKGEFDKGPKEKMEKLELKELKEKPEKRETKDVKEKEKELKEKNEGKEQKEKPEKLEGPEGKAKNEKLELKELKEFKELDKPLREKELKELDKPIKEKGFKEKDLVEGPPTQPIESVPGGSIEERLANLEAAVAQFSHFIRPELRPDLSTGALSHESDVGR